MRERGAQGGCIATADKADAGLRFAPRVLSGSQGHGPRKGRLVKAAYQWNEGTHRPRTGAMLRPGQRLHVVAHDFGIKR